MKIIFLIEKIVVGGVEKQMFRTIEALNLKYGCDITIATDNIENNDFLLSFISNHQNVKLIQTPSKSLPPRLKNLKNILLRKYKKLLRKINTKRFYTTIYNGYDVIIDYKNAEFYTRLNTSINNKTKKTKIITILHGSFMFFNKVYGENHFREILSFYNVVCLTNKFRNQLIEKYHFTKKYYVIYNSLDFEQVNNKANCINDLNLPKTFISCVARLSDDKDHETLINAFAKIEKMYPELKLILVGDGNTRKKLEFLVENLNLKEKIIFLGTLLNPFPIMKKSLFTILSSKSEGLPLVLLEALSLKVPIISADCPDGPGEVLNESEYGLLFKPGDVEDLKLKMIEALENPKMMQEKANLGFQSLDRFDLQKNTEQLYKIMQSMVEQK